jgi:hypothetical protein
LSFKEGEERRKKEEGRRKKEEGEFSHSSYPPLLSKSLPLPLSSVPTAKILPIKCFNYSGLVTKSSKKFMRNQEKSVILVF